MTWPGTDRQLLLRVVGAVVAVLALSAVYMVTAEQVRTAATARHSASQYKATNVELVKGMKDLQAKYDALLKQQRDLTSYLEDHGTPVPSNLGGTAPATTVIREHSDSGDDTTRIIERSTTTTMPSSPSATTTPQAQPSPEPSPAVKVPEIPTKPIDDIKDNAGDLLKGTPLDGVF